MDPDKMRHCMSLGYSAKSKMTDTIGQYGNGFKTSTMRLGADVIVFSRCGGRNGQRNSVGVDQSKVEREVLMRKLRQEIGRNCMHFCDPSNFGWILD